MTALAAEGPNAAQISHWNEAAGPTWVATQRERDQELGPLGLRAMEALGPCQGERIIDVGCGCGDTTLELARRVGPAGLALGADISAPMLDVARQRAGAEGLTQARFVQVDAQTHAFEPADGVFSRFGVMFFADPAAAFANLRKALRPGGRVAFVCWRALAENQWISVPMAALAPLIPAPPAAPPPNAPGPFAFADRDRLRAILADAGFADISIEANNQRIGWGDLAGAVRATMSIGPVAQVLREYPALQEDIAAAIGEALAAHASPEGVLLDSATWIVRAG
jgi:SAM-dependent methyltransferase